VVGRRREHLTPQEAERLIAAAGELGRNRLRDQTLCLMLYRHGLRASEAVELTWDQVDLEQAVLHVVRLKNGNPAGHPLAEDERELLEALRGQGPVGTTVFLSERGTALDRINLGRIVRRAGKTAGISFPVHPHMLRHATGYYLANRGQPLRVIQDYLGHRSVQHTVHYTRLAPERFAGLWR
jgi:type 1 fimbriae regulatory protein FimB/type 1 fimbriae regulatory protein FimE